jgi:hypothetical protein
MGEDGLLTQIKAVIGLPVEVPAPYIRAPVAGEVGENVGLIACRNGCTSIGFKSQERRSCPYTFLTPGSSVRVTGEGKATALDVEVGHSRSAVQDQQRDGILVKAHRTVPDLAPLTGTSPSFSVAAPAETAKKRLRTRNVAIVKTAIFCFIFSHLL